jgi:HAD superfamily hydrolase (TIGR01509 family)
VIRGLVFDFDGLIVDTEGAEYQSWQELFRQYGRRLPLSVWSQAIGAAVDHFDAFGYLESLLGHPIADRERVKARRRQRYLDLAAAQPVLPGVREAIAEARRQGLKLAMASSSSREWVVGHMTRLGLIDGFECVRTSDDVAEVKPNPALYLSALAGLGLAAHEAIAFEDSPNGIAAAKAAGLFCVAIPNPLTSQLPIDQADLHLSSLAETTLDQIISLAGKPRT